MSEPSAAVMSAGKAAWAVYAPTTSGYDDPEDAADMWAALPEMTQDFWCQVAEAVLDAARSHSPAEQIAFERGRQVAFQQVIETTEQLQGAHS